jgi:ribosomal protein S12 methylthiotransferase
VNDSEVAAGILENNGHKITKTIDDAQAIIVNTCGFINDAKQESIEKIFDMVQRKNDNVFLIVSGCLSQRYQDELYKQMPEVDIFIGVNDYVNLPKIIANHRNERQKHFSSYGKEYTEVSERKFEAGQYSATLKVAEGCDNSCAYCVIPSIRGKYRSRKKENIVNEAIGLAERGCKELIIVAQDVTSYGIDLYGKYELAELLRSLCIIDGIRWIRLMYCYEDRITDELVETMRTEEKICNYIDIPIQHCNDKILKAMNRRSTKNSIMSTFGKLRKAMPDIHIRTTVITGLPGEGNAEFSELLEFIEEVRPERLGAFAYSKEEGTPAAKMKPQVRSNTKESRKDAIMLRQIEISLDHNIAKIGKTLEVLVEEVEELDDEVTYYGRSRYDAPEIDNSVIFTSDKKLKPGDMINVEIVDAFDYDLVGKARN